jgi:exodeoxyribonuclease VII large subunit
MNPITVSALTLHISLLVEGDELLRDLQVTGEVSNWKRAASGHIYFRLKDAGATINAVMWKGQALAQGWLPREGDQVIAHGYVGVYAEGGSYQLYVNRLQPAGRGQLYAQFEALKARLAAEGLFDAARKRLLPARPRRIGVVTSPDAAALRDILRTLAGRWPLVDVVVFPTLVQGGEAPGQIVAAIQAANRFHLERETIDVLIVGRGGGSLEDLWAFNDERVARAIAASAVPTVSAVGHETDFTIADFVADVRAPTPTGAATLTTPNRADLLAQLAAVEAGLQQRALTRLQQERRHLEQAARGLHLASPRRQLDQQRQRLDDRIRRLDAAALRSLERARDRLNGAQLRLTALNPQGVLERGYSIVQRADGRVVTAPEQAAQGDPLLVRAAGGSYRVVRQESG